MDERHFMSCTQAALVLGASGSVGTALIKELIRTASFQPIVTLVRRPRPDQVTMARDAGVELRETLVPAMDPAGLETATREAIRSLEGDVVGLSVLGVGAGTAGMARYARVKGEAEEAVKESGPAVVSIFRPAMIIGSQHTPWLLEKVLPAFSFVTPAKYKSITVEQIAKAMIATSQNAPAKSDVYDYPEMMVLNR